MIENKKKKESHNNRNITQKYTNPRITMENKFNPQIKLFDLKYEPNSKNLTQTPSLDQPGFYMPKISHHQYNYNNKNYITSLNHIEADPLKEYNNKNTREDQWNDLSIKVQNKESFNLDSNFPDKNLTLKQKMKWLRDKVGKRRKVKRSKK